MLQITSFAPANVVSVRVQHRVEPGEMARVVRAVEDVLERHDRARVCLEIECWDEWTLIELACDFRAALDHLPDFEREVLIANAHWQRKARAIGGRLFSSLHSRHFLPSERDEARRWLGENNECAEPRRQTARFERASNF